MQEFSKIRDQLGPLITKVSKAQDGSYRDRLATFSEALEKMPVILKAMKETPPNPNTKNYVLTRNSKSKRWMLILNPVNGE